MLAFSRRQMLRPRVFDIGLHLRTIEPALGIALEGIGKLRVDVDPHLGNVYADPSQIERALLNLVVNARDAVRGRKGASVIIRARNVELSGEFDLWLWGVEGTPGPFIRIDVEDNGPGVDEKSLPHLFEPFYSTKGQGPAGGLGLATAYGIVKQSNGYIWAHSAVRGGAVFSVYLPRMAVSSPDVPAAVHAPAATNGAGNERILLVEDEDAIRRAAKRSLELAGYRITEAADGAAALQLAEQNEFDLLLTDVEMPKMLGTTLVERLRDSRPRMPVLFMSGHSDQLLRDGMIDSSTPFLAKPFTPPQLAEKVRETLARSRSRAR
jgi:CheY-like chemotaxis protein